uniref:Nudix (nucleoside diphosphate linked moiety X)-type motif 8 n=1 Tax=Sinocyclocheilus grahami TaxID=75366 RepID=A0A672Q926_SINGR
MLRDTRIQHEQTICSRASLRRDDDMQRWEQHGLFCSSTFRGGKKDRSVRTVVDTALREACEELGIHITEDKVWGVLKPLHDMSGMMIAPVIANLGPLEALSFRPNPSEVEEIFTLTFEHLCQPQNRGYTHFRTGDRYGYTLPVFHSPKHRVWGLTAVALDHTLKIIMPPNGPYKTSFSVSKRCLWFNMTQPFL